MRLSEREYSFYISKLKLKSLKEITLYKQMRKLFGNRQEASDLVILSR